MSPVPNFLRQVGTDSLAEFTILADFAGTCEPYGEEAKDTRETCSYETKWGDLESQEMKRASRPIRELKPWSFRLSPPPVSSAEPHTSSM